MSDLKQIYYNAMLLEEEDIPAPYTLICEFRFYKLSDDSILKKLSIYGIINRNIDEKDLFKFKTPFEAEIEVNNINIKEYLEQGDVILDDLLELFSNLYDENIMYNAEISRFKDRLLNTN